MASIDPMKSSLKQSEDQDKTLETAGPHNRSMELSESLESITSILSSKYTILSTQSNSVKNPLAPKERLRLIRMVNKVIQLANEVLDLNYTVTSLTSTRDIHNEQQIAIKNKTSLSVGDIIPINLITPCRQTDANVLNYRHSDASNNNNEDNALDENSVIDDYELPEMFESRSKIQKRLSGKFRIGFDLLQEMILLSNHMKGLVTDMIRKNLMKECLKMRVPDIFKLPKNVHENENIGETLTTIYQTLANQTAHLYFVWFEQKKHINRNSGCTTHRRYELSIPFESQQHQNGFKSKLYSPEALDWIPRINKKAHLRIINNDFLMVSNNLRSLMCYWSQTIHLFNIPVPIEQIVTQVLSHRIRQNVLSCSRRSILECQLMRDAVKLFSDIEDFLRKESHRFLSLNQIK